VGFAHGRLTVFKLNAVDLSAWTDNTDFTDEADVHDTTTYGKTAHTKAGGLLNSTFAVGGTYDVAAAGPEATIRPLIGTTTAVELGPEGSTAAKKKISGSVVVKNFNTSHPVAGMVKWKCDLEGTDTLTVGVYP
jgi:hypothetical protein